MAAHEPARLRRLVLSGAVAGLTTGIDLLTKAWAWDTLRTQGARGVIAGRLQFEFSFNTGSAFGMLRDAAGGHTFFVIVSVLLIIVLLSLALRLPTKTATPFVGIGLALGGVLGNLHDRLFRELLIVGEGIRPGVVDFIVVFYAPSKRWPAFNIADVTILIGAVLLFGFFYRLSREEDEG